jgi:hypothetical protein
LVTKVAESSFISALKYDSTQRGKKRTPERELLTGFDKKMHNYAVTFYLTSGKPKEDIEQPGLLESEFPTKW